MTDNKNRYALKENGLEIVNDWEVLRYFWNGNQIDPKNVACVRIGTEWFDVSHAMVTVPYNDMGHTYHATQTRLLVSIPIPGTRLNVKANVCQDDLFKFVQDIIFKET